MYDPARIQVSVRLVPSRFFDTYLAEEDEADALPTMSLGGMAMMMNSTSSSNVFRVSAEGPENGLTSEVEVTVHLPSGWTDKIDVFSCDDEAYDGHDSDWALVCSNITPGVSNVVWTDAGVVNESYRFYTAGNADLDSDGDDLPDARELLLYETKPDNADTDGDGVPDGWEVAHGHDPNAKDTVYDLGDSDVWIEAKQLAASCQYISTPCWTEIPEIQPYWDLVVAADWPAWGSYHELCGATPVIWDFYEDEQGSPRAWRYQSEPPAEHLSLSRILYRYYPLLPTVPGRLYRITVLEVFEPYSGNAETIEKLYKFYLSGDGTADHFFEPEGGFGPEAGQVIDAPSQFGSVSPVVLRLDSTTVATQPAERSRKTVGVGEEVTLTLEPTSLSPVTWSISGEGALDSSSGNPVTFTAHDRESTATIIATYAGFTCSVSFTVIQPSGVLFENVAPIGGGGTPPTQTWIGFQYKAGVYIQPDTVNFYNIKLYESNATAQTTGYFADKDIPDHSPNGPHDVAGYTSGKGSSMAPEDWIGGSASPDPFSDGTIVWPIDWLYSIGSGLEHTIQTVDQKYTLDVEPGETVFRIEKGASGYHISTTDGVVRPN